MTGRARTRRAVGDRYHHGNLRRALVEAALEIVGEKDVASVSLREVARRAGVSPAAPYHHFSDKSFLLAAVAEDGFRRLTSRMREALEQPTNAMGRERLERLGRAYVRFATAEPAQYRVMFSPEFIGGAAEQLVHPAAMEALNVLVGELHSQSPQAARDELLVLAVTVWSACHGLALLISDGVLRRKEQLPIPQEDALIRAVTAQLARLAQDEGGASLVRTRPTRRTR